MPPVQGARHIYPAGARSSKEGHAPSPPDRSAPHLRARFGSGGSSLPSSSSPSSPVSSLRSAVSISSTPRRRVSRKAAFSASTSWAAMRRRRSAAAEPAPASTAGPAAAACPPPAAPTPALDGSPVPGAGRVHSVQQRPHHQRRKRGLGLHRRGVQHRDTTTARLAPRLPAGATPCAARRLVPPLGRPLCLLLLLQELPEVLGRHQHQLQHRHERVGQRVVRADADCSAVRGQ
eukprot:scaffold1054_cov116-Isochrysis_galbana.AAC.5